MYDILLSFQQEGFYDIPQMEKGFSVDIYPMDRDGHFNSSNMNTIKMPMLQAVALINNFQITYLNVEVGLRASFFKLLEKEVIKAGLDPTKYNWKNFRNLTRAERRKLRNIVRNSNLLKNRRRLSGLLEPYREFIRKNTDNAMLILTNNLFESTEVVFTRVGQNIIWGWLMLEVYTDIVFFIYLIICTVVYVRVKIRINYVLERSFFFKVNYSNKERGYLYRDPNKSRDPPTIRIVGPLLGNR